MKRALIPLIALALAAGACSSNTSSLPAKSVAAVPAGTLYTAWGAMPTYRTEGNTLAFAFDRKRDATLPREYRSGDSAVIDVLVDRNGSIRDVKVQRSSGADSVDRFLMNQFVGARSLLEVAATDAAPYVLRQTFSLGGVSPIGTGQIYDDRSSNSKFSDITPMGAGSRHPMDR